jgi:hypothetical protein
LAVVVTASTAVVLPVPVEEAWGVLSDTPRMVALDPLIDRYEPELGTVQAGTLNRVRGRLGPFPTRLVTRTEVIEPPRRAVFVSVAPSRPVQVRAEETLEPVDGGCRLRVTVTVTPTMRVVGPPAAWATARLMVRARRRFLARLRAAVADEAGGTR